MPVVGARVRPVAVAAVLLACLPALAGCDPGEPAQPLQLGAPAPPEPPALPGAWGWPAPPQAVATTAVTATTRAPSSPTTAPTPSPTTAAPTATATFVPQGPCLPLYGPAAPVPLTVSTKPGSVVVTWWHNGDPAAVAYLIALQSHLLVMPTRSGDPITESPFVWYTVPPPAGCRTVSFTVPGMTTGVDYSLVLSLRARTPETVTGVSQIELGRTTVRLL